MSATSDTCGQRGRPRDPDIDRAIVEAVATLLGECGFDGVTMEDVAARAEVSKASLYRRFAGRSELLDAACIAFAPPLPETPDTGSVRDDLVVLIDSLAGVMRDESTGRVLPAILAAAASNAEAREALARFSASRRSPTLRVLQRAVERGELRSDADPEAIVDLLVGAVMFRSLIRNTEVMHSGVTHYVELVLSGTAS